MAEPADVDRARSWLEYVAENPYAFDEATDSIRTVLVALGEAERELAALRGDVADLEARRVLGPEQCCELACDGGGCEICPCCCAGWCVFGHGGMDIDNAEDRASWLAVAVGHNPVAAWLGEAEHELAMRRDLHEAAERLYRVVAQGLAPLCPCADRRASDYDGPDQGCPLHGDGDMFVAEVQRLRGIEQRARTELDRRIPDARATARRILSGDGA